MKDKISSNPIRIDLFSFVAQIPKGKVTTYKILANKLNISPRHVGKLLHTNTNSMEVPCHRIVKSDLRVANGYLWGGLVGQTKKLIEEQIEFTKNGKIHPNHLWSEFI